MFREKKLCKRKDRRMKVAALYDIHGNLPALEAVLEELEQAHFDLIVIGGDIGPGPMPKQTLQRLLDLGDRARFIRGNCERDPPDPADVAGSALASGLGQYLHQ